MGACHLQNFFFLIVIFQKLHSLFWIVISYSYMCDFVFRLVAMTSSSELGTPMVPVGTKQEKVCMKKQLGLLEGVAIILGIIFGSGLQLSFSNIFSFYVQLSLCYLLWFCSSEILQITNSLQYVIPNNGTIHS